MPITDLHPDYEKMLPRWMRMIHAESADEVKEQRTKYLPRGPGHSFFTFEGQQIDTYSGYLHRAVWLPYLSPVKRAYRGLIFSHPPQFKMPDEVMQGFLEDVTLEARKISALARAMIDIQLGPSFGALMTDFSVLANRPKISLYSATNVRLWRERAVGGRKLPVRVVLEEQVEDEMSDGFGFRKVTQLRSVELVPSPLPPDAKREEYPLGGTLFHVIWRKKRLPNGQEGDEWEIRQAIPIERRKRPLGFIPVVPFHPCGTDWRVEAPALIDLVDMLFAHFNNSADYEDILHKTVPTWMFSGVKKEEADVLHIGGLNWSINPQAKGDILQTEGAGADGLQVAMEDKRKMMAVCGARLILAPELKQVENVEAKELRLLGDDATLSDIAVSTGEALHKALTWFAWWHMLGPALPEEVAPKVTVDFNTKFITDEMSPADAVSWMEVMMAGELLEDEFDRMLRRGRVIDDTMKPEERRKKLTEEHKARAKRNEENLPPALSELGKGDNPEDEED